MGTLGFPPTIDGGGITAPNLAFYNMKGEWDVENIGVAPDIEVEYSAAEVIKGRDPQLERGVQEALKLLEQNPVRRVPRARANQSRFEAFFGEIIRVLKTDPNSVSFV